MLRNDDQAFIDFHLLRVSRTFAPGIAWLRIGLRAGVGLAYLLCRIIDTIEDSAHLDLETRVALLRQASEMKLESAPQKAWADAVAKLFANDASDDGELCHETGRTLALFAQLPEAQQKAIAGSFRTMAAGMARFAERAASGNGLRIASYEELREYCYYVAGTVGEMLSRLFGAARGYPADLQEALQSRDVAFGIGLQIVNILKGVSADYQRQAHYVPDALLSDAATTLAAVLEDDSGASARMIAAGLIQEALTNLDQAIDFTLLIPETDADIRAFCAFPIVMALRTCVLALEAEHVFPDDNALRVPRPEVEALLATITQTSERTEGLQKLFQFERECLSAALGKVSAAL